MRSSCKQAGKIAFIYCVFGAAWIIASDRILVFLVRDAEVVNLIQTVKGWIYVAFTAWLVFVLARRELAQREELEKYLRDQQKLEILGSVSAGLVHEIRNPVAGIRSYAELLVHKPENSAKVVSYSGKIVKASDRIICLVENMLKFVRKECSESVSVECVQDVVNEALDFASVQLKKDCIIWEKSLPGKRVYVRLHPGVLHQVLMNLITNAKDALNDRFPDSHPEKTLRVFSTFVTKKKESLLRISVEDNGAGIPNDIEKDLFRPFFTTKSNRSGTGLGLAISRRIVQDAGGQLSFETVPGKGTVFHVDLNFLHSNREEESASQHS